MKPYMGIGQFYCEFYYTREVTDNRSRREKERRGEERRGEERRGEERRGEERRGEGEESVLNVLPLFCSLTLLFFSILSASDG